MRQTALWVKKCRVPPPPKNTDTCFNLDPESLSAYAVRVLLMHPQKACLATVAGAVAGRRRGSAYAKQSPAESHLNTFCSSDLLPSVDMWECCHQSHTAQCLGCQMTCDVHITCTKMLLHTTHYMTTQYFNMLHDSNSTCTKMLLHTT